MFIVPSLEAQLQDSSNVQSVRPRKVWRREAQDFTPWLAENLSLLAQLLKIELEFEAREKSVGAFRADLVCRNPLDNSRIVIENQLNTSDHGHLGQVLTYAAGLQAVTIVWLAEEFRDEHRATLDWQNEITDARFKFFGVELQTWEHHAAHYTAQLSIVSKPDDWILSAGQVRCQIQKR